VLAGLVLSCVMVILCYGCLVLCLIWCNLCRSLIALSCLVLSCLVLSCPVLSCHSLPRNPYPLFLLSSPSQPRLSCPRATISMITRYSQEPVSACPGTSASRPSLQKPDVFSPISFSICLPVAVPFYLILLLKLPIFLRGKGRREKPIHFIPFPPPPRLFLLFALILVFLLTCSFLFVRVLPKYLHVIN
jgi:hypothetical protein